MESWLESNLPPVGKRYGGDTLQNLWYSTAREASLRKQPSTRIAPHSGVVCGRSVCDCPALVWLTAKEEAQYQTGERLFLMNTRAMKVLLL
jgi:hypothetical protein